MSRTLDLVVYYPLMEDWTKSESFFDAFSHAFNGVVLALKTELNLRRQLLIMFIVLISAFFLGVSLNGLVLLILASAVVVVSEMFNTALEYIEDVIHPEYHDALKRSKDASAGAVLIASIVAIAVGLLILIPPLMEALYNI